MLKLELQTNIKFIIIDSFGGYLYAKISGYWFSTEYKLTFKCRVTDIFHRSPKETWVGVTLSFKRKRGKVQIKTPIQ